MGEGPRAAEIVYKSAHQAKSRILMLEDMDGPWTDGLERLRGNEGYSSVVRVSGGKDTYHACRIHGSYW